MTSTSALLNKPLRTLVVPILRDAGFQHVDARNGWSWRADLIWVFNIRSVGSYFSDVTGWPPGSICAWLGVFFTFAPPPSGIKIDDQGRLRPAEHLCHMRNHLVRGVDQSSRTRVLKNLSERERQDVWWVLPHGENVDEVANDIAKSLHDHGLPWYVRVSNLESALDLVEAGHDCFVKYPKAAMLARHLGDDDRWRKYDALAETEARRIGHSLDRDTWLGI